MSGEPYVSPVVSAPTDNPSSPNPYVKIPMPEGPGSESFWATEIERADEVRKKREPKWKQNLKRYEVDRPSLFGFPGAEVVTVPVDFANTESKKAQLFYQQPDVVMGGVRPEDRGAPAYLAQAILNETLKHEINIMPTVDECLMDVICAAGIACSEIAYQAFFGTPIQEPVMVDDQSMAAMMKRVVGMEPAQVQVTGPDGQPQFKQIPNLVHQRFSWDRYSPMTLLIPGEFIGSDFDKAWWLGRYDLISVDACKQEFGVVPQVARVETDEHRLTTDTQANMAARMVQIVRIWYQSCRIRPDVHDPRRFTQLVLACGKGNARTGSQVLVHRDSPLQEIDKRGRFVRGMLGNPIHPLTIRYTPDSAWPLSDCSVSRPQVDELSQARTQQQMQRKRDIPLRAVDVTADEFAKETVERIEKGQWQGVIPTKGDPNKIIKIIARASFPSENFRFSQDSERDIARAWGLGANQSGSSVDASTATEAEIMQRNTDTRLSKERDKVVGGWYVLGSMKLFALIQMFGQDDKFIEVLGEAGAKQFIQWNRSMISGQFRGSVRPDSSIRVDQVAERERALRFYNQVRNDPNFNGVELDKELCEIWGKDPTRFLVTEQPKPQPELPKLALSMDLGEDLAATNPSAPVNYEILAKYGIPISEAAKMGSAQLGLSGAAEELAETRLKHPRGNPGTASTVPTIDQHEADRTGQRTGPKVTVPMQSGVN